MVCGDKEHIRALNYSLRALRKFTSFRILVVTDSLRNEQPIDHPVDDVLDIRTPFLFDNHQASIYLKTGLHKFLSLKDNIYCYLDGDVIALNHRVNEIFDFYLSPIIFSSDHCKLNAFSSAAVYCRCNEKPQALQSALEKYESKYKKNEVIIERLLHKWRQSTVAIELDSALAHWYNRDLTAADKEKRGVLLDLTKPGTPLVALIKNYLFRVFPAYRRSLFSRVWKDRNGKILIDESSRFYDFMRTKGFVFNRKTKAWETLAGVPINRPFESFEDFFNQHGYRYDIASDRWYTSDDTIFVVNRTLEVEKDTGYHFINESNQWVDDEGNVVFSEECDHLALEIEKQFQVNVSVKNWQHWNGGVFVFNDQSVSFMETWHQFSLRAFSLPYWKTRDQGTLIASVWKLGLQNHPLLPIEFNFLADYNHPTMTYEGRLAFRTRLGAPLVKPSFIHIYHNWGNPDWNVWNDVDKHLQ